MPHTSQLLRLMEKRNEDFSYKSTRVVAFGKLIYSWRRNNSWWAAFVFKQKFTHWSSPRYYFNADNTTRSKRLDCLTWSPLTTVRYKRVFHLQKNDNAIVKKGFWNLAVWEEKWVTYLRFQSGQVHGGKINVAKNCLCTPQEFESEENFSFSIGL